jgi:hypothetical protein
MRTRAAVLGVGAATLVVAVLWTGIVACAGPGSGRRTAAPAQHPEVDADLESCATCHAQATPEIVAQWSQGRHGLALVECVVCHGSTGADFRPRPESAGCRACHPVQVSSVTRGNTTKRCFECHTAHALRAEGKASPHGAATGSRGQP